MAFVMIATGATSRSRVRTLSVRPLVAAAGLAALALLGSAVDRLLGRRVRGARGDADRRRGEQRPAGAAVHARAGRRISGRLFRLESEAAQLSKRIGVLGKESAAPARTPARRDETPAAAPAGASGGPWLAPHAEAADGGALAALDAQLGRIEQQIAGVASVAAQRSLEQMRLPTRLPIVGAELTSGFGNGSTRSPTRTPFMPASTSRRRPGRRSPRRRAASSPSPASSATTAGWSRSTTATAWRRATRTPPSCWCERARR